ncbi:MAG: hypothetical protein KKA84_16310 [Bacteroidetes bacterium]|nr:hypothetical protein [Bacteroidota bacterium]
MSEVYKHCQICQREANIKTRDNDGPLDVACYLCGNYTVTQSAYTYLNRNQSEDCTVKLKYWLSNGIHVREKIVLSIDQIKKLIKEIELPNQIEQAELLFVWLAELIKKPEVEFKFRYEHAMNVIGAYRYGEYNLIFEHLKEEKLIQNCRVVNGTTMGSLTIKGWRRYRDLNGTSNREVKDNEVIKNISQYKFTNIKLTQSQRLWLTKIYSYDFKIIDEKTTLVSLVDQLEKGFDYNRIDSRLLRDNRLTLIGLWHIDRSNKYFNIVTDIALLLKKLVKSIDWNFPIKVEEMIGKLKYGEREISIALMLMFDLGFFSGGSNLQHCGMDHMRIDYESGGLQRILHFNNIYEEMEDYFDRYVPLETRPIPLEEDFKLNNKMNVWDDIKGDYELTKREFGKRINFITDKDIRTIIFRDVEQAYYLYKNSIYKPAIILSGSVIEEILRQLLLANSITPKNNSFDHYLKICQDNKILEVSVNRLLDSARHFRNYIHIENEGSKKNKVSKPLANTVVSSLFVFVSGFKQSNKYQ